MNKYLFAFIFMLSQFVNCFCQEFGVLKDTRDGKVYKTVIIGEQVWMAENLNVSKFRNGDIIPEAKTNEEWIKAGKNKKPAWCYYDNNPANGVKYGKLYNWYAVNDPRGLAPNGWHVPDIYQCIKLSNYLGGENIAGKKMKTISYWMSAGGEEKGNLNTSGFSALPAGHCGYNGVFDGITRYGYWWTTTSTDWQYAYNINLFEGSTFLGRGGYSYKHIGLSVRCIKD